MRTKGKAKYKARAARTCWGVGVVPLVVECGARCCRCEDLEVTCRSLHDRFVVLRCLVVSCWFIAEVFRRFCWAVVDGAGLFFGRSSEVIFLGWNLDGTEQHCKTQFVSHFHHFSKASIRRNSEENAHKEPHKNPTRTAQNCGGTHKSSDTACQSATREPDHQPPVLPRAQPRAHARKLAVESPHSLPRVSICSFQSGVVSSNLSSVERCRVFSPQRRMVSFSLVPASMIKIQECCNTLHSLLFPICDIQSLLQIQYVIFQHSGPHTSCDFLFCLCSIISDSMLGGRFSSRSIDGHSVSSKRVRLILHGDGRSQQTLEVHLVQTDESTYEAMSSSPPWTIREVRYLRRVRALPYFRMSAARWHFSGAAARGFERHLDAAVVGR